MCELLRRPVRKWKAGSLVWSTQFSDLRNRNSLGKTRTEQHRQTLLEIKSHALLLPRILIRDADLVNHMRLQEMIVKNVHGIRGAIENGSIVLGIRGNAGNLTEVNETAGIRRAFPKRYLKAQTPLAKIDQFLSDREICLAEGAAPTRNQFARNLRRVLPQLDPQEADLLQEGISVAEENCCDGSALRFGDIFDFLVRKRHGDPYGNLVQWCRAAHLMVFPGQPSFAPSTADRDLRPEMVAVIANYKRAKIQDPRGWIDLYPRRILPEDKLLTMSFDEIAAIRETGQKIGYFQAVYDVQNTVHQALDSRAFESANEIYLRRLAEYLEKMGTALSFELVDWQRDAVQKLVNIDEATANALCYAVPYSLGGATAAGMFILAMLAIVPMEAAAVLAQAAMEAAGKTAEGLTKLRAVRAALRPSPLSKLLAGTTITPNSQ